MKDDPINPKHYTRLKITPTQYIKANKMQWNEANVIKYISRYKNKDGLKDLKKAIWYIEDLINDLKEKK